MKVHVPVDVRYGTEVFFAVEAAKCSSTVGQNDRTTRILSLDWSSNDVQPELLENNTERIVLEFALSAYRHRQPHGPIMCPVGR